MASSIPTLVAGGENDDNDNNNNPDPLQDILEVESSESDEVDDENDDDDDDYVDVDEDEDEDEVEDDEDDDDETSYDSQEARAEEELQSAFLVLNRFWNIVTDFGINVAERDKTHFSFLFFWQDFACRLDALADEELEEMTSGIVTGLKSWHVSSFFPYL